MTHSIHARRKDVIEARNYEVALSSLIREQKDRVGLVALSSDLDLMKSELQICQRLEKYRRELLDGVEDKTAPDSFLLDSLVRSRIPACTCRPDDFSPGQYCGDCGAYCPDGDEF